MPPANRALTRVNFGRLPQEDFRTGQVNPRKLGHAANVMTRQCATQRSVKAYLAPESIGDTYAIASENDSAIAPDFRFPPPFEKVGDDTTRA